jgi:hypothetical protein
MTLFVNEAFHFCRILKLINVRDHYLNNETFPIMKTICTFLLSITIIFLTSCSNSPTDKAQTSVKKYLKKNLKLPESYEPIAFSRLDTLETADTSDNKLISPYQITHIQLFIILFVLG